MNTLKRVLTGTLALAMAASMLTACGDKTDDSSSSGGTGNSSGSSDSGKIQIKFATFTDETATMMDIFENDPANADIVAKYEFVLDTEGTSTTYQTKTLQALASDADAPDIFVADADYARLFAVNENTASLADLGIEINASDYYQYVLDFTAVDGVYKGVSHQAAPGVVLYRRDYAEEVLGSGDPETVQAAMSDWTKFKETADKMKEKGYYMISGLDELKRCFLNNRDGAWVTDDMEFYCDDATVKEFLELTKALNDAEETAVADNTQWGPSWYQGMKQDVFCYFGCTWYLHYTIKPNCLTEASGGFDEESGAADAKDEDFYVGNGSFGKWGAVAGPAGYFWGGTWWFGSKAAAADPDKAEAVKAVIEYFCVNDDSVLAYMQKTGDFSSKPAVNEKLVADETNSTCIFLDGQDYYTIFREAAPKINASTCSQYDNTFNDAFNKAIVAYCNGTSYEDTIAQIKADAKEAIADLK